MSIKLQKIIRFVPALNFFVTGFSLIKAYRSSNQARVADMLKIVLVGFILIFLVNIPQIILLEFIENAVFTNVLSLISNYATLFVLSSFFIMQQEKYIMNDGK